MPSNRPDRVFISADMEGTSGLERLEEIFRGLPGYEDFRRLMAGDVNAVVEGVLSAGVEEVVVADSHGYMKNIYPEDLHPDVAIKRGMQRDLCQMKSFDPTFDAVILCGYHAKAGTEDAIISHTWIPEFHDVRVNGRSVGEPSLNAYLAGAYGASVVMLTGCDRTIEQAKAEALGDDVAYAQVKESLGYFEGDHLPLEESRPLLRETAERAVSDFARFEPVHADLPVTVEVDIAAEPLCTPEQNARWIDRYRPGEVLTDAAMVMDLVDDVERSGDTISFTYTNYPDAYRKLHEVLLHVYERGIETLIDEVATPDDYNRPDLDGIVGAHPVTELGS